MNYLALGDSYTIGEQVDENQNFPQQLVQLLNDNQVEMDEPKIIAKTGWTTDELIKAIAEEKINETFSIVTLLIGVNNQYRKYPFAQYQKEFDELLATAIRFANGRSSRVFVLSIPDWGVTPFAADKNEREIAQDINQYNAYNREAALLSKAHWLNITESTRKNGHLDLYLAPDGLHPSGLEYKIWAEKLLPEVIEALAS